MRKVDKAVFTEEEILEAITNSIKYDYPIRHWFFFLLLKPRVRKEIEEKFPEARTTYSKLRSGLFFKESSFWLAVFVAVGASCLLNIFLAVLSAAFLIVFYFAYKSTIVAVIECGAKLLELNKEKLDLANTTLYKSCEQLSRIYETMSLVDVLVGLDRCTMIGAFFSVVIVSFSGLPVIPIVKLFMIWILICMFRFIAYKGLFYSKIK